MKARKIVIFIWIVIALLAAGQPLMKHLDRQRSIDTTEGLTAFEDALEIDSLAIDSLATDDPCHEPLIAWQGRKLILDQLMAGADSTTVRVMHYGDSQIEEDRITCIIRRHLQERYGGGGVGLIPLHQTIPTQTLRQRLTMNEAVQTAAGGPTRYLVYGPKNMRRPDGNRYGPMGQVAIMDDSLTLGSETLSLQMTPISNAKHTERYFNRIHVFAEQDSIINVRDSSTQYILALNGKHEIYGISLETKKGVIVDNIPMRGCSGYIFTQINRDQLVRFYRDTHTRLIILQYGGNMMPYLESGKGIDSYVSELRRQVEYLKSCAPEAAFLFIGPSDMLRMSEGEWTSYSRVPALDSALSQMAREAGIAYWSLYQAMGGEGSMKEWQAKGWAGSDGIHFSKQGAEHAGELLWTWMSEGQNPADPEQETTSEKQDEDLSI
ncbi:MAG: GDSL-type esterase/lipase family protein [Paludibacteraceae bacterium]|nr:GDSL-type esterase/lipase family protein [Paludibacteraceae bacterium]